jgi:hypothetical protein
VKQCIERYDPIDADYTPFQISMTRLSRMTTWTLFAMVIHLIIVALAAMIFPHAYMFIMLLTYMPGSVLAYFVCYATFRSVTLIITQEFLIARSEIGNADKQ